jgi:hypothetical protein|tara:strand:- start:434 stop:709 length:276 start_codon:yes stop_codon:yes gene_type:complete
MKRSSKDSHYYYINLKRQNKVSEYYTPLPEEIKVGLEVETNNCSTAPKEEQVWHKLTVSEYIIDGIKSDLMGHCPQIEVQARTQSIRVKKQ